MKYIFCLVCLLVPASLNAQGLSYNLETATSSGTIYSIAIASQPSMDVGASVLNGKLNGAYAFEIYNHSASTSTINCSFDANVSTTEFSASFANGINPFYGREIAAGVGIVFHFLAPINKLFCMSQSVKGPTAATVTQLR